MRRGPANPSMGGECESEVDELKIPKRHYVLDAPLEDAFPGMEHVLFGMGCFWGAERKFWTQPGVVSTAVGYSGGETENPSYEDVCSGRTGHAEVVRVVFDPKKTNLERLLVVFWENHDPTQGHRQGNDVGSQYRSAVYAANEAALEIVAASRDAYQRALTAAGLRPITTEVRSAGPFYFAEAYHQQYLAKNPNGYCGLGGTGVACSS